MDEPDIVYEMDINQLQSIAQSSRLAGLCFALTMRWIRKRLCGYITFKPSFKDLKRIAAEQLDSFSVQGTDRELRNSGMIYGSIRGGDDFGQNATFDDIPMTGRAHVLSFSDSFGQGHRIGIFVSGTMVTVFDQNIGEIVFTNANIRDVVRAMVGPTDVFRNTSFAAFRGYSTVKDGRGEAYYSQWELKNVLWVGANLTDVVQLRLPRHHLAR